MYALWQCWTLRFDDNHVNKGVLWMQADFAARAVVVGVSGNAGEDGGGGIVGAAFDGDDQVEILVCQGLEGANVNDVGHLSVARPLFADEDEMAVDGERHGNHFLSENDRESVVFEGFGRRS